MEPVRRPALPAVGQARRPANAVDLFVFAKLAKAGLAPSRLAKRPVLIRRLYLVMLGIHPSPREVAAFVNAPRPDAWERLVDRVLDDPRLGERWARMQFRAKAALRGLRESSAPYDRSTCAGSAEMSLTSGTLICMRAANSWLAMRAASSDSPG